jgi:hypothetical protein
MNVGYLPVSLVDDATKSPRGTALLPCLEDDDGSRHFFGPLLVSESKLGRSHHYYYSKIRHLAKRRPATSIEMAFVKKRHPDLWERIVRERRAQIDQSANKGTRRRTRRRQRQTHTPTSIESASTSPASTPPPLDETSTDARAPPSGAQHCPKISLRFRCGGGAEDAVRHGHRQLAVSLEDDGDNDNRNDANDLTGNNNCDQDDDHDDDDDYDADGAGDLVPIVRSVATAAIPSRSRGAAAISASTVYLIEATSLLIEFLGADIVCGSASMGPSSAPGGIKRTWGETFCHTLLWASARDLDLDVDPADRGVQGLAVSLEGASRQRHRKKHRPMRSIAPAIQIAH